VARFARATFLLLVAAVLAGAAAVVALATGTPNEPTVAVTRTLDHPLPENPRALATATVTMEVTFRGLSSGQSASIRVTAPVSRQVLATAIVTPSTDGTASRTLTLTGVLATEPITVLARGGTEQCTSHLGSGTGPATLSCGPAS
jgi:hypothetical protein